VSVSVAWGGMRKMECREWRGTGDFLGTYTFSLNENGILSIIFKPKGQFNWLFATNVKKWTLAWEKDGRVLFYGLDGDVMGPVKVLSLDFAKLKMFDYVLGGVSEDSDSRSLTRKECHRVD
jgi:hypothetical protein